ncbi:glycosyl hydrolase [Dactylonectria macrodidyma]|uniref:Glycosyl hydrolase n=1 Tax=Dactylonectria macrodidyma TaxID=307937 RepID=A0A9P9I991_9HYPO|nr:glycosyl hydrolase [Dactylonectria macrodidyma]
MAKPLLLFISCAIWIINSAWAATLTPYQNPILPGWHSDPSCVHVKEWDDTTFCTTSSFLAFPGAPVYASKDLINWRLASNAYSRRDQIPGMLSSASGEQEGLFANTLRMHKGTMYLITLYVSLTQFKPVFLLFTTTNPFDDAAWTGPITVPNPGYKIDPDIFWDDDGSTYVASSGLYLQKVDLKTGKSTDAVSLWNGTGGLNIEGPHIYKKDGWYYLLAAEGGTEMNHSVTMARSRDIFGPYESNPKNPVLTNRGTDEYFQTVGHTDLFQDGSGNWWGCALSTRSGPDWTIYPMGRETVLFPVSWPKGKWPTMAPVRGHMTGPLPPPNRNVPSSGAWVEASDKDLPHGREIPRHFIHWRPPPDRSDIYEVVSNRNKRAFSLKASWANLTAHPNYSATDGQTFMARRQSHTAFSFSVHVDAKLKKLAQETGISVFLTSHQHIDLSIVMLPGRGNKVSPHLQLRTEVVGKPGAKAPKTAVIPVPKHWRNEPIRLTVTGDEKRFYFLASRGSDKHFYDSKHMGSVSAAVVSGGSGPFTGTLLGAYATTNGGSSTFKSHISRWTYTPISQKVE